MSNISKVFKNCEADLYFAKMCEHLFELLDQQLTAVRKVREKDRSNKKLSYLEDRLGNWCQALVNAKELTDKELTEMGVL